MPALVATSTTRSGCFISEHLKTMDHAALNVLLVIAGAQDEADTKEPVLAGSRS
jgi:hypothetical protein